MPVMHQAVKAFLANQRQGNASTKTREVSSPAETRSRGSRREPAARVRARRALRTGSAVVPCSVRRRASTTQDVPRQVRALARKSALNARAREGAMIVIDAFNYDAPKHAADVSLLGALGVTGQEGADPHRRREAERVPERPQPPDACT